MNEKLICRRLRKVFNIPAFALLVYYIMMNVLVSVAVFAEALLAMLLNSSITLDKALENAAERLGLSSGNSDWRDHTAYLEKTAVLLS